MFLDTRGCIQCGWSGDVGVWRKSDWAFYAFRCNCQIGINKGQMRVPEWTDARRNQYIPRWEHPFCPEPKDIIRELEAGNGKTPEFQKLISIWGREMIENIWNRHKKEKEQGS